MYEKRNEDATVDDGKLKVIQKCNSIYYKCNKKS